MHIHLKSTQQTIDPSKYLNVNRITITCIVYGTKSICSALVIIYIQVLREQKNRETFITIIPIQSLKRVQWPKLKNVDPCVNITTDCIESSKRLKPVRQEVGKTDHWSRPKFPYNSTVREKNERVRNSHLPFLQN